MKKILSLLLVCGIISGMVLLVNNRLSNYYKLTGDYKIIEVEICSGDTLWNLGRDYCSEEDNIKTWISEVKKLNSCTSELKVGQNLKLYCSLK